jgi:phosphatidylcholine synthase
MDVSLRAAWPAALVHVFTALGSVCALLAILALWDGAWETCFAWLGLALVIDGTDGLLARIARVEERLPRFSGERLDVAIDYVTYVLVPALALLKAGFLGGRAGVLIAGLILLSSLYHFSDTESKTDDNCFVGFPAIWNAVAFYLFAFAAPPWASQVIVLTCVVLTFVPLRWAHPMRSVAFWPVTVAAMVAWTIAALRVVWNGFPAGPGERAVLLCVAVYAVSLALLRRRLR